LPPGGLPPGEFPDGLLLGANELKEMAATITIPRMAMMTTADPRGIRGIGRTMRYAQFKDSGRWK